MPPEIGRAVDPIALVVGADVLESRDEQRSGRSGRPETAAGATSASTVCMPGTSTSARSTPTSSRGSASSRAARYAGSAKAYPTSSSRPGRSRGRTHGISTSRWSVPGGPCSRRGRSPRRRAPFAKAITSSSIRIRSNSVLVTSSCRSVARESVPSASFASERSRASGSASRRSARANTESTKASSDGSTASRCARRRGSTAGSYGPRRRRPS